MSRRSAENFEDEATLPITPGRKTQKHSQKLLDPQAPLAGAMKRVGPKPPQTKSQAKRDDPKHLRDRYRLYCSKLAEYFGNPVPALADVFEISREEAEEQQIELHAQMMKAMQGVSTRDLFQMNQMSKEHRLMRLREYMYAPHPAVSMKAMEMLNDLDGSAKSSGDTWEEWAAMALGRKA